MKIFIRTFNPDIVAKTGAPLPKGKTRDGTWWKKFEDTLIEVVDELGYEYVLQPESPIVDDNYEDASTKIFVHKTFREKPEGDLFYMQMHLKELFVFDKRGWGADHSKKISLSELKEIGVKESQNFVDELQHEFITTGESKHKQPKNRKILSFFQKEVKDYILIPLQIPRDYVIKHHSPISVLEFINTMASWAKKNKKNVVFKLHPHNKRDKDIIRSVRKASLKSKYVFVRDGNIHEMISKADGVVVINSGVGFESLIHRKPVATFGNCDYKVATLDISIENNLNRLKEYIEDYKNSETSDKLVYHYCNNHGFFLKDGYIQAAKERMKEILLNTTKSKI